MLFTILSGASAIYSALFARNKERGQRFHRHPMRVRLFQTNLAIVPSTALIGAPAIYSALSIVPSTALIGAVAVYSILSTVLSRLLAGAERMVSALAMEAPVAIPTAAPAATGVARELEVERGREPVRGSIQVASESGKAMTGYKQRGSRGW